MSTAVRFNSATVSEHIFALLDLVMCTCGHAFNVCDRSEGTVAAPATHDCTHGSIARCRSVNWLLRKYPEARRRNLQMHAPIMVSMWPSARLVQESSSMMTVGEVWEQYWARAGRESDKAIILFKDRVHQLMAANQEAQQPSAPSLMSSAMASARIAVDSC